MSLDHILLGMLARPAAGYDLGREFESSASLFWHAELSQIYPTLRKLERAGFLESEKVPSDRGPDRRVYHRTPEGAEELATWLRGPPELGRLRLPHVAQFFFLDELDDLGETERFVRSLREQLVERLRVYADIEGHARAEGGDPDEFEGELFHHWASLRQGILVAEARLAWCDETLTAIAARRAPAEAAAPAG